MSALLNALLFILVTETTAKLPLPPYITKCQSRERESFSKCALENARGLLTTVIKTGDRKYGLPLVDPAFVERVSVEQNGLNLEFLNITITAIPSYNIEHLDMDLDKKHLHMIFGAPKIVFKSQYKTDGRLLLLSLKGTGTCEISFDNYKAVYHVDYDLVKNPKDGEEYVKFLNTTNSAETDRAYFKFDNLFNGDPTLGKATNDFLNENWKVVFTETSSTTVEALGLYLTTVLQNVFDRVSYKVAFPE